MKTCSGVFKETSPIFVTLTFGKKSQVIGKKTYVSLSKNGDKKEKKY